MAERVGEQRASHDVHLVAGCSLRSIADRTVRTRHDPALMAGGWPVSPYPDTVRIATWNVNSLKARTDAVEKWLGRAQPDIFLMQETKLADSDAPELPFRMLGYELVHH